MEELKNLKFDIWHTVSEEFLYEKFINDEPTKNEKTNAVEIDPEKIHFVETPFDRYYYKQKFPAFDDELCEILEKCSIDKQKKNQKKKNQKLKKPAVKCSDGPVYISFD